MASRREMVGSRSGESAESAASRQVRAEYREMPGLKLTAEQAARLWNLDAGVSEAVLRRLSAERVLRRTRDGSYVRAE